MVKMKPALLLCLTLTCGAICRAEEANRCNEKELEQSSQEYEQCHSRALSQLQAERPNLEALRQGRLVDDTSNSALCAALNSLIEDCTVILGWCFTSAEVNETKTKQKEVLKFALARMIPDFVAGNNCFDSVNATADDDGDADAKEKLEQEATLLIASLEGAPSTTTPEAETTTTTTATAAKTSDTTAAKLPTSTTPAVPAAEPTFTTRTTTTTSSTTTTAPATAATTTRRTSTTFEQSSRNPVTEDKFATFENEVEAGRDIPGPFPGQRPLTEYRAQKGSGVRTSATSSAAFVASAIVVLFV